MQASQAKINQDVAIALERITARLENMESWRNERDEERRRQEERRDERDDKRPDVMRGAFGTYGGCLGQAIYAVFAAYAAVTGTAGIIISVFALTHH